MLGFGPMMSSGLCEFPPFTLVQSQFDVQAALIFEPRFAGGDLYFPHMAPGALATPGVVAGIATPL